MRARPGDLGRGGGRVDAQLARGQQVDGGAGIQVAGEAHVQGEPRTERDLDVQLLRDVHPGGGTDAGDGVVGGAEVHHEDPQHRRAAAGPGLHEGDLGDAVGEPGEPVQQLLPPQVAAPLVVLREAGERVVEQVAQLVEAEPALDVRRRGGGRGDRATLHQAEQLADAGDDRVPALEVVRHQVADQPFRERGGKGLDLRTGRPGGSAVHGVGDAVDGGGHGGDDRRECGECDDDRGDITLLDGLDQVLDPGGQVADRRRRVTDRVHHTGGAEHGVGRRHPELGEQRSHLSGGEPVLQRLERAGHLEREGLDGHGHGWSSPDSSSVVCRGVPVSQATSRGKTRRSIARSRGERSTRVAAGGPTLQ